MLDWIVIALLAWQVWMPAVDNAKFSFAIDKDGTIVRMNTQSGEMERCDQNLVCGSDKKGELKK